MGPLVVIEESVMTVIKDLAAARALGLQVFQRIKEVDYHQVFSC